MLTHGEDTPFDLSDCFRIGGKPTKINIQKCSRKGCWTWPPAQRLQRKWLSFFPVAHGTSNGRPLIGKTSWDLSFIGSSFFRGDGKVRCLILKKNTWQKPRCFFWWFLVEIWKKTWQNKCWLILWVGLGFSEPIQLHKAANPHCVTETTSIRRCWRRSWGVFCVGTRRCGAENSGMGEFFRAFSVDY